MTWSCLGFLSKLVPTSTSLARSLTASSPSKTVCVLLFPVSLRELVFCGWWNQYPRWRNKIFFFFFFNLWTTLCYFVAILHLFSKSFSIVLQCGGQLQNVTFSFLNARCIRWPGFVRIRVSCRSVIDVVWLGFVWCTWSILTLITVCSASFHLLSLEFDIT